MRNRPILSTIFGLHTRCRETFVVSWHALNHMHACTKGASMPFAKSKGPWSTRRKALLQRYYSVAPWTPCKDTCVRISKCLFAVTIHSRNDIWFVRAQASPPQTNTLGLEKGGHSHSQRQPPKGSNKNANCVWARHLLWNSQWGDFYGIYFLDYSCFHAGVSWIISPIKDSSVEQPIW